MAEPLPDQSVSPFLLRAADRLYRECERAIRAGRVDARSPIGDATLDYRELREDPLYASPASDEERADAY